MFYSTLKRENSSDFCLQKLWNAVSMQKIMVQNVMSEGNCGAQVPQKSLILCLYTILDQNSCVCILSYRLAVVAILKYFKLTGDIRCKDLFYKGMRTSAKNIKIS